MTPDSLKGKRLVGLFIVGLIFFNYPILSLFNLNKIIFGIPILYVYVFMVWFFLILLIVFITIVKSSDSNSDLIDRGN